MINRKNVLSAVLSAGFLAGAILPLRAAVNDDIQADNSKTAQWLSEELANAMSFNAASVPVLPADVPALLGFEVGVAGGLSSSKVDVSGFRALPFSAIDNKGSEINLPDRLPVPGSILHAKVGLPMGFDVGAKYGGLSFSVEEGDAEFDFTNHVYGIEVRKRLLGGGLSGTVLPDLALSVAYDAATGDLTRKEVYNTALTGTNSAVSMNGATTWKSHWDAGAITARAVVSKQLLMVTPYVGAGVSQLTGDADTTVTVVGTLTPGGAVNLESKGTGDADRSVVHALGGAEVVLFPLVRLSLGYLWSQDDWAASGGLRLQFR